MVTDSATISKSFSFKEQNKKKVTRKTNFSTTHLKSNSYGVYVKKKLVFNVSMTVKKSYVREA